MALKHGAGALADGGDAWETAFGLACQDRLESDSELVPYWIYPLESGAKVERHILALPLSRELDRLKHLRDALAVYRLAFGQARLLVKIERTTVIDAQSFHLHGNQAVVSRGGCKNFPRELHPPG